MDKMFKPKSDKIAKLGTVCPNVIKQLESIFDKPTNVYLDYSNMFYWSKKLHWNIDQKRLKQFLDSFENVKTVGIYNGTLGGNLNSEKFVSDSQKLGYKVVTKPVKIMKIPIDISGIAPDSTAVINNFVDKALIRILDIETIEYFNEKLRELNSRGIKYIEKRKCNFDVEIGVDMLLDFEKNHIDNFVIWTGDSDFAGPINTLIENKKKVVIVSTARRISTELNDTGAQIFEIQKIRDFICWDEELTENAKKVL